jgi:thymidylate synthase
MYIVAETLDDLLRQVVAKLVASKVRTNPTRGAASELSGVLLKLKNPRARLSRTESRPLLFGCLGELLWYLAGSNNLDFIAYYLDKYRQNSDDGRTLHGAYGTRLHDRRRSINQIENVLRLLRTNPDSRRAVIQLFDAADIARKKPYKEVPCTCTLQFLIRGNRLQMITNMRSNDVFLGFPHDVFAFTMIQEIIARALNVDVGEYKHAVGSLHLYEKDKKKALQLLNEGWQTTKIAMPPMTTGDPFPAMRKVLNAERSIRLNRGVKLDEIGLDCYWADIVRLLQIYWHFRKNNSRKIRQLKAAMNTHVYDTYIDKKRRTAERRGAEQTPAQADLFS